MNAPSTLAEELNAVRSIATVAPLRNGVAGGCTTVPVGSLPISPPDDDLRDAKRLKVCANGLGEPGTTELGITCKSGIRYNGIGYNGIRHNEVSSKQESGIT